MADRTDKDRTAYGVRARVPQVLRAVSIAALAVAIVVVLVGLYRERSRASFRLKGEHAQLSKEVVAEVSGYERLEHENGVNKYFIRADHAKTFSDDHQEFSNIYVETFDSAGVLANKMTAEEAIYVPEKDKNFTLYLKGNVNIDTAENAKVRTQHIVYNRGTETAEADEAIEYSVKGIRGKSFGALVRLGEKRVELLRDVEIEAYDSPELQAAGTRYARLNSGSAVFDQTTGRIELQGGFKVLNEGTDRTTRMEAVRGVVNLVPEKSLQLASIELYQNVRILGSGSGDQGTELTSGTAFYDRVADRFDAREAVHIVSQSSGGPLEVRAREAVYERTARKLALAGPAEITQASDVVKGDSVQASLFADNGIEHAVVRGNAFARRTAPERMTSITSGELNATFGQDRAIDRVNAVGRSTAELIPTIDPSITRMLVNAASGIGAVFSPGGLIAAVRTDGRTSIDLTSPNDRGNSTNKRLTADAVKTLFAADGKNLVKVEAAGDGELYIEPHNPAPDRYRTTVKAPRFECDFFPSSNDARSCVALQKVRTHRVPTVPREGRGEQTLTGNRMTALFDQTSKDLQRLEASGATKFTELDRTATAERMIYTQADEVVSLRGGAPLAWDSRARVRAAEIDWNTRQNRSYMRGGVSTTYYSSRQMRGASPFAASDRPVYATADTAEFDHSNETAVYTGNTRAWQDNNYVRSDKLFVDQGKGTLRAEGNVNSLLYDAKLKGRSSNAGVPVSAAAGLLTYDRNGRVLRYRQSVDIRHGSDRVVAEAADVFLDENNDVLRTVAETDVVITQPGRRATGSWAEFTADNEVAIVRGEPAVVVDGERGTTQAGEVRINLRDNRVSTEGRTKQNASARIRSVYKTKINE